MKKIILVIAMVSVVSFATSKVFAANGTGTGTGSSGQGSQGVGTTEPVQNKNQEMVQNQGEETQLRKRVQEQQGIGNGTGPGAGLGQGNGQNAGNGATGGTKKGLSETRSAVAQQVQKLLNTQGAAGGIGSQVKEWAQAQNQAQQRIAAHLEKVEGKASVMKSLFGPNYGSLNELKQEMEQNRVRIQQLTKLKTQLTNQADLTNVQEMITLLQQENTALQDKITDEEGTVSLFGWLVKLLNR